MKYVEFFKNWDKNHRLWSNVNFFEYQIVIFDYSNNRQHRSFYLDPMLNPLDNWVDPPVLLDHFHQEWHIPLRLHCTISWLYITSSNFLSSIKCHIDIVRKKERMIDIGMMLTSNFQIFFLFCPSFFGREQISFIQYFLFYGLYEKQSLVQI